MNSLFKVLQNKTGPAGLMALFLLAAATPSPAANDTFTGASDTNYLNSLNWSTSSVPAATDSAFINDLSANTTVNYNATADPTSVSPATVASVTINANSTFTNSLNFNTTPSFTTAGGSSVTNNYFVTAGLNLNSTNTGSALVTGNFGGTTLVFPASGSSSIDTNQNFVDVTSTTGLTINAGTGATAGINISGLSLNNQSTASGGNKQDVLSLISVGNGGAGVVTLGGTGGTDVISANVQSENEGAESRPSYIILNLGNLSSSLLTINSGGLFQGGYTGVPASGVSTETYTLVNGAATISGGTMELRAVSQGTNFGSNNVGEMLGTLSMTSGLLQLDGNTGTVTNATGLVTQGLFKATGGTILFQIGSDHIDLHNTLSTNSSLNFGVNSLGAGVTLASGTTSNVANATSGTNLAAAPTFEFLAGTGSTTLGASAGLTNDQGFSSGQALFNIILNAPSDQLVDYIGPTAGTGVITASTLQNFKMLRITTAGSTPNVGTITMGVGGSSLSQDTLLLGSNLVPYAVAQAPIASSTSNADAVIDLDGYQLDLTNVTTNSGIWNPGKGAGATEWVILNSFNSANGSTYTNYATTSGGPGSFANSTDVGIVSAKGFNLTGNSSTATIPYYIGADVTLQATGGGLANNLSVAGSTTSGYIDPASTFLYTGTGSASTLTTSSTVPIGKLVVGDGTNASTLQLLTNTTAAGNTTVKSSSILDLNTKTLALSGGANLIGGGTLKSGTSGVTAAGAVTFVTGGLQPNATVGNTTATTLTLNNVGITLASGSNSTFNINSGSSFDSVALGSGSSIVFSGTLTLDFTGSFTPTVNQTFDLFSGISTESGNFTSITSNISGFTYSFDPTTGLVMAVPEPATVALLFGGLVLLAVVALQRRLSSRA